MLNVIQGEKLYAHCYTWRLIAHTYTWSEALCSMLYKGESLCSLLDMV